MSLNREIIQHLYGYFATRDLECIRHLFDENIEWHQMKGFPGGGSYIGADAIFKNVFGRFGTDWTGWKAVTTEFTDAEDSVFVTGYYEGIYKLTNKPLHADFVHRYTLKKRQDHPFQPIHGYLAGSDGYGAMNTDGSCPGKKTL